jgi:hypothetical protein
MEVVIQLVESIENLTFKTPAEFLDKFPESVYMPRADDGAIDAEPL